MKLVGRLSPENLCLFKVQMNHRVERGHANRESSCYRCLGYDKHCEDYTPIVSQKELIESLTAEEEEEYVSSM